MSRRKKGDYMKAVLMSIKPKWCELIANGTKTVEVRKTKPKIETPFKVYIYCTKGENLWKNKKLPFIAYNRIVDNLPEHLLNGKVIGEFVCDRITEFECSGKGHGELATTCGTCLTYDEIINYCNGYELYGWHISDLIIYDKPKELNEFVTKGDCTYENCKKCKWFEKGNGYNIEADCLLPYHYDFEAVKPLFKAPQSWYYVEQLQ